MYNSRVVNFTVPLTVGSMLLKNDTLIRKRKQ